jgi:hypothetical protein
MQTTETVTEAVPCGTAVTTIIRDESGAIVRQDCAIHVSTEAMKSIAGAL